MKASEARELTEKYVDDKESPVVMEFIYKKIKNAASAGANRINNPFEGFPRHLFISQGLKKKVCAALENEGYVVGFFLENTNPNDPKTYELTYIEW